MIQRSLTFVAFLFFCQSTFGWGFYAHKEINYHAVFLLPPAMLALYKPNIDFIAAHAVDPDKRRYIVTNEAPRHFIDLNRYGSFPFFELPHEWPEAVAKFGEDSLMAHGIVPWWVQTMLFRLTNAFKEKNYPAILKLSAEIAHYISDAHVPLHAHSNYNGQLTGQHGIHGLWESRIPELIAAREFNYFVGKAAYLPAPGHFIWQRVLESAAAADTVLLYEKQLTAQFNTDQKFAYEERNGILLRQYSRGFAIAYHEKLKGMVERRMQQSIFATASLWYTAWINAGQPALTPSSSVHFSIEEQKEFEEMDKKWKEVDPNKTCGN